MSTVMIAQLACSIFRNVGSQFTSNFHTLSKTNTNMLTKYKSDRFLEPTSRIILLANSMQTRWTVVKECPDCYYVWRESRKYVYCKKHPSHNQQTRIPKDKERFIITHKTGGRKRPW